MLQLVGPVSLGHFGYLDWLHLFGLSKWALFPFVTGDFHKIACGPRGERKRRHVGGGVEAGPPGWSSHSAGATSRAHNSETCTYLSLFQIKRYRTGSRYTIFTRPPYFFGDFRLVAGLV